MSVHSLFVRFFYLNENNGSFIDFFTSNSVIPNFDAHIPQKKTCDYWTLGFHMILSDKKGRKVMKAGREGVKEVVGWYTKGAKWQ